MIFCGISQTESICLHEKNNLDQTDIIDITTDTHEPKFYVYACSNEEYMWEFRYTSKTDYERIKMCIIDVASDCDSLTETLDALSGVFLEYFDDILWSEEHVYQCGNESCNNKLN